MQENKYDDPVFFAKYNQMARSREGLAGAGEWPALQRLLPDFTGKRVLDLGCGLGWHCQYAVQQGASRAVGLDISEKMLARARELNATAKIDYLCLPMEDLDFPPDSFEVVISSLAIHYIASFDQLCLAIRKCLTAGGDFVFSVEHPIFTAYGTQDWYYDQAGQKQHWPIDHYFSEGARKATFLGEQVTKYHRTLTTYLDVLLNQKFSLRAVVEPQPQPELLARIPDMAEELRRPMMLLVAARKEG